MCCRRDEVKDLSDPIGNRSRHFTAGKRSASTNRATAKYLSSRKLLEREKKHVSMHFFLSVALF
jgi:hypothetical protein